MIFTFQSREYWLIVIILVLQRFWLSSLAGNKSRWCWTKFLRTLVSQQLLIFSPVNMKVYKDLFTGKNLGHRPIFFFFVMYPPLIILGFWRHRNIYYQEIIRNFISPYTGDEMFCDSYKMTLVDNVVYEVQGKVSSLPSPEFCNKLSMFHFFFAARPT
jgi:hypothetical protein